MHRKKISLPIKYPKSAHAVPMTVALVEVSVHQPCFGCGKNREMTFCYLGRNKFVHCKIMISSMLPVYFSCFILMINANVCRANHL